MDKKYDIYAWACDLSNFRGEGILGTNFLKHLSSYSKKIILAESPEIKCLIKNEKILIIKKKEKKKINFHFIFNYIYPFIGLFKIWFQFLLGKKVCYVNFLPLWNCILFLFFPSNIILGPITGSLTNHGLNLNSLIRRFLLPIFYSVSVKICIIRRFKLLFTTEILRKFVKNKKLKCYFNYNLINFENTKKKLPKKNIDFLFYYRKYSTHGSENQVEIIKKLLKKKINIYVVGDHLNLKNVRNLGIIQRFKLFKYLEKTKFSINESSNFYSIFCLDCISNGVKVFYNKDSKVQNNFFPKSYFLKVNFSRPLESANVIIKNINKKFKSKKLNLNKEKYKKKYFSYFSFLKEKR